MIYPYSGACIKHHAALKLNVRGQDLPEVVIFLALLLTIPKQFRFFVSIIVGEYWYLKDRNNLKFPPCILFLKMGLKSFIVRKMVK